MSTWFQGLFHPPYGVLFTFPSRYLYAIGRSKSLALEGGPPSFPQGFTCLVVLRMPTSRTAPVSTGLSPPLVARSNAFESAGVPVMLVLQPQSLTRRGWFGLFPVRSPLLRESRLISLRRATEMFQFAHGPPPCLYIQHGVSRHHSGRVAPFGYSGLLARMQLPLNVSPVSASFIGLQRLGIHLVLYVACMSLPSLAGGVFVVRDVSLTFTCGDSSCSHTGSSSQHASPHAFLCFSLLALGKIEVIILLRL